MKAIEVVTSVERRRRYSVAEKIRLVEESGQPGMSVSYVARKYGISPSMLFGCNGSFYNCRQSPSGRDIVTQSCWSQGKRRSTIRITRSRNRIPSVQIRWANGRLLRFGGDPDHTIASGRYLGVSGV
jgi:Transposase